MKILIDFIHMADVNFYKKAVTHLSKNNQVSLVALPRGKLIDVLHKEYNLPVRIIGKYYKRKLSKIFGIIHREILLFLYLLKGRYDVVSCFGFYPAIAAKFLGIPSVIFHDDPEYKKQFGLCKFFADRLVIPSSIQIRGRNIVRYKGYKELAYLYDFKPNRIVLKKYKIKEDKYVFLREVSTSSWNYFGLKKQDSRQILDFIKKEGYQVVVSLEDKKRMGEFKECIILKEPVDNIYSLVHYAAFAISSGDTVVREAALLGVPSLYTGGRDMVVNKELIDLGLIMKVNLEGDIKRKIIEIKKEKIKKKCFSIVNNLKKNDWVDTTQVIVKNIQGVR